MGQKRNACSVLVGKHEVKRSLGRPRCSSLCARHEGIWRSGGKVSQNQMICSVGTQQHTIMNIQAWLHVSVPFKPDRKRRLALVGDNIKVDFGEIEWRNMGFVRLARDRDKSCAVVNT